MKMCRHKVRLGADCIECAEEAGDEAIERVARRERAVEACYGAAVFVCTYRSEFTSQDVRRRLRRTDKDATRLVNGEARVLGAVMRRVKKDQLARPAEAHEITGHKPNHGRPQRVWISMVRGP